MRVKLLQNCFNITTIHLYLDISATFTYSIGGDLNSASPHRQHILNDEFETPETEIAFVSIEQEFHEAGEFFSSTRV